MMNGLNITRDLSSIEAFHLFDCITFCDKPLEYSTDDMYRYIRVLGCPDDSSRVHFSQKLLPIKMGYVSVGARFEKEDELFYSVAKDAVHFDELRIVSFVPKNQNNRVAAQVTGLVIPGSKDDVFKSVVGSWKEEVKSIPFGYIWENDVIDEQFKWRHTFKYS